MLELQPGSTIVMSPDETNLDYVKAMAAAKGCELVLDPEVKVGEAYVAPPKRARRNLFQPPVL